MDSREFIGAITQIDTALHATPRKRLVKARGGEPRAGEE
jgi:hypothetical protein